MRTTVGLVVCLVVTYGAAAIGGLAMSGGPGGWYQTINKPTWNPPGWVFGPVWTLLYTLMAIAAWLVWRRAAETSVALPLALFAVQLALNAAWTWFFFGWHQPGWAFGEIALLWVAILATMVTFWRVTPTSGALLVPYLAWVSFAGVLNFTLWRMNP